MPINQISVFVENKPGRLAFITGLLSKNNIDIRAFSMADTTDFGIMRIIVNDPEEASAVLRDNGLTVSKTEVLAVRLEDVPGALDNVLGILAGADVSIEYAYAFLAKNSPGAVVIVRVVDIACAEKVLKAGGIDLLSGEEVYGI